jgi:phosphoribosyl-ATP pyrophosphohydrolase/phosphoribosyl-AMP cyclohydrolase
VRDLVLDCDQDTLLVRAHPVGPTCHTGADTCFYPENKPSYGFLSQLAEIIHKRRGESPETSYTASLFAKGMNKIAQKVGEEAVEVVIEAKDDNRDRFLNESADLLFHWMVLLEAKGVDLDEVVGVLRERNKAR